jgi:uncharacterized protein YsxB (DUF464 family)
MLDVIFYRDSRNRLSSFSASGHAEFAEHGEDIVCAAISAILQAARLGLEEHANVVLDAEQEPGVMQVRWPEAARDDDAVRAIVTTAELAAKRIAGEYPKHARVRSERQP